MRPKVSVVIPVYNRAHSVLPTLQSVQSQTLREFECIVIDDGSKDGDLLRKVVESLNDHRFRYVRRENGGGSAARNTGIDEASGEFVAFLDSDDRWLPDKLSRDAEMWSPDRVVFSPMFIERAGKIVGRRPRRGPRHSEPMGDYLAVRQGFVPTSTLTMPRGLAAAVRYRGGLSFGDDVDFAIRLDHAGAAFKFLPEPQAVMCDDEAGDRLSRTKDWESVLAWTECIRPLVSNRAYQSLRGWHAARIAAISNNFATALSLYIHALSRGAFPPGLAAKALAQIVMPRLFVPGRNGAIPSRQTY